MRRAARMALLAGVPLCGAVCGALCADQVAAPPAAEITQLTDAPGRDVTVAHCILCHSVEYIPANAPAMDRASWQKSVQKMRERFGAPLTDEEARQILDYLAANYSGKKAS